MMVPQYRLPETLNGVFVTQEIVIFTQDCCSVLINMYLGGIRHTSTTHIEYSLQKVLHATA